MQDIIDAVDAFYAAQANQDGEAVKEALAHLKSLSQHPVYCHYYRYGYAGLPGGIFSVGTPFEILHVFYLGTMKNILDAIFNKLPPEQG